MKEEILDYTESEKKKPRSKHINLIPFYIICLGIIWSGLSGFLTEVSHILGLIGVVITSILLLKDYKKGIFANGILLLMGCINLASFYPFEFAVNVFEGFSIGIDFLIVGLTAFFLILNHADFEPQFHKLVFGNEEMQVSASVSKVNGFKRRSAISQFLN